MKNRLTHLILSCFLISLGFMFLSAKLSQDVYKQTIIYGIHDVDTDIDLTILFSQYKRELDADSLRRQVGEFVDKLNFNVSDGTSPCSILPVVTKRMPVLIFYDPSMAIKVELVGNDKKKLNECAKSIDNNIENFNFKKREYYLALMKMLDKKQNIISDIDYSTLNIEERLDQLGVDGLQFKTEEEKKFNLTDKNRAEIMGHFIMKLIDKHEEEYANSLLLPFSGINKNNIATLNLIKIEVNDTSIVGKVPLVIIFISSFIIVAMIMFVYFFISKSKKFKQKWNYINKLIS
tara:strand:+ start:2362 stop:3234 length:873 start_codon:yes stop_codon:yes gene_type:complete